MTPDGSARATDAQLLTAIAHDDAVAYAELFSRYAARAIRVASSLSRSRADAEDCVQDAFASIWRGRASYVEGRGSASGWVLGITRNRAIDLQRRQAVREVTAAPGVIEALLADDDTSALADVRAQAEHLGEIIGGLSPLQREVIALAFYGQLTYGEIARRLDLPEGTVKGRARLGLAKLRTAYGATA
jgi:RNA polymerase sigma-70 factor (ECF subfamily)